MNHNDKRILDSLNKKQISPNELSGLMYQTFFFVVFAVALPIFIFATSLNIIFRIPDVYRYEIKKNEITEEFGSLANEDLLAENISKFFTHGDDSISIMIEYNDKYGNAFSNKDIAIFKSLRKALDATFFVGAFCLIAAFIAAFYLLKKKRWRIARNSLWLGGGILAGFLTLFSVLVFLPGAPKFFVTRIAGEFFDKASFVGVIIDQSIRAIAAFAAIAICLVVFGIIASILFKLKTTLKLSARF